MDTVVINSVALFNFADVIFRNKNKFGILLGERNVSNGTINVYTSFEIVLDNLIVDVSYLKTRLDQFRTVFPQYELVGIYELDTLSPLSSTVSVVQQVVSFLEQDDNLVILFYDGQHEFKSHNIIKGEILTQPLSTSVRPTESEEIVNSTISNHSKYSNGDALSAEPITRNVIQQKVGDHCTTTSKSLDQLSDKVQKIVNYLQKNQTCPEQDSMKFIQIQNLTSQLAHKIEQTYSTKDSIDYTPSILTSKLGLLNTQVEALENLHSNISRQIIRFGIISQQHDQIRQISDRDPSLYQFSDKPNLL
ncbi:hypothetical protein CAAN1_23S00452 [[Candida] anglica]|uniref:JAB1/MPN/MOV34 metalloenzyme domain-containing protein n=1 Tax=[Candida] anglica TaxID=148631 RepID=A0ABP0E9V5_9ASCO